MLFRSHVGWFCALRSLSLTPLGIDAHGRIYSVPILALCEQVNVCYGFLA